MISCVLSGASAATTSTSTSFRLKYASRIRKTANSSSVRPIRLSSQYAGITMVRSGRFCAGFFNDFIATSHTVKHEYSIAVVVPEHHSQRGNEVTEINVNEVATQVVAGDVLHYSNNSALMTMQQ